MKDIENVQLGWGGGGVIGNLSVRRHLGEIWKEGYGDCMRQELNNPPWE